MKLPMHLRSIIIPCIMALLFSCESGGPGNEPETSENLIRSFYLDAFPNQGVINYGRNSIMVFGPCAPGTDYVAHFIISNGATSTPESGSTFTVGHNSVQVIAENGDERTYDVILEHRNRTALLIIDLQNANFPVFRQEMLLATINSLHEQAHRCDAVTIFIQHTHLGLWEEGSYSWQIHSGVKPGEKDIMLKKETISAMNHELQDTLNAMGIHRIVLTGTLTELCISETIIPSWESGFHIVVPETGHSTNDDHPEKVISQFYNTYNKYIEVLETEEISLQ
ncbi:MAG: isochorismatase family cysteine hydrolase [Bacteroidota bacterium]